MPIHMSSVGLCKKQVSLASLENWLCLKTKETKVHSQSKFLLSLSLQVVLCQSGAFILRTITNLPSINGPQKTCVSVFMCLNVFCT